MDRFPQLYTPRLLLRKLEVEDVPSLVKEANNPKIADRILNIPHPYREPDAVFRIGYVFRGFKEKSRYVFAIIHQATDSLIGEISLHLTSQTQAQLGYWIGETHWKQGYASESVQTILPFGFEQLSLDLIFATCKEDNLASIAVLRKNGLQLHSTNGGIHQFRLSANSFQNKDASSSS
ncbi:MAG: GNAT family N-acetyltransferase [Bacteroidota bacterium]